MNKRGGRKQRWTTSKPASGSVVEGENEAEYWRNDLARKRRKHWNEMDNGRAEGAAQVRRASMETAKRAERSRAWQSEPDTTTSKQSKLSHEWQQANNEEMTQIMKNHPRETTNIKAGND
ncbi:hypothetical protein R1flu_004630 [Riccia fluitans]|uniref:Uncharacterized protein n=1 Tax=Riccia fluitans TaxID=41844 RepID=A0ABD1YQV0_9MARC